MSRKGSLAALLSRQEEPVVGGVVVVVVAVVGAAPEVEVGGGMQTKEASEGKFPR